jgi:putative membrane protein
MYFYIKALHIIFVVTWFSGLFYIVRLFVYSAEANEKPEPEKSILLRQFNIMQKRLWYGITWPSAIITLFFGVWVALIYGSLPAWLLIKLGFVAALYIYHFTLHIIFIQQKNGEFKFSSQQLRIWNEVATVFLICIVMLAVVKQGISILWGLVGLFLFIILLMSAIKVYKLIRTKDK